MQHHVLIPINKKDNNKCFQNSVTVALNYEEIKKYPQKLTKIKPFINIYNCQKKIAGKNFIKIV